MLIEVKDVQPVANVMMNILHEDEFKHWLVLHISRWDPETALHLGDAM